MDFILTASYLNQNYYSELKIEIDTILKLINSELAVKYYLNKLLPCLQIN